LLPELRLHLKAIFAAGQDEEGCFNACCTLPPHISPQVSVRYLNRRYPKYWFGRFGPQA
jgi:hypothetical protein